MIAAAPAGLIRREELSETDREEMFELMSRHFAGVTREQFERDLNEKNWVLHIRRECGLVGFTSLLVCDMEFDGEPLTAIYSGDTIVAPEAWNAPALPRAWIAAVDYLREQRGDRPCFWLLLTSGFRTYRLLPVFWRTFYPHHAAATPAPVARLMHHLAGSRYGDAYRPELGLVRFPQPQTLRGALAEVPNGRSADEHVAFFLQRNPLHSLGDELVCLTEIRDDNLTAAGRRMTLR